jgi:anion-transporting  ArsA/GET3 family ATPase
MMENPTLLDKRLLIVSGKGGVGKSVVAATLAWIAAKRGKRTLLVELDTVPSIARMFGKPQDDEYRETELLENLSCFHVEGKSGLEEYLRLVLKSGRFVGRIVRSPIYQYFVNVAPGLKELMAVGKLWDLEQKRIPGTDRPRYDLIVADTPATGHVLSYLQMPMTAADTAKGFVKREAQKVADLLQDPVRTAFNIVTTLAEMPVNEAIELYESARSRLHLPIGCLFVNQVHPPFLDGSAYESYRKWQLDLSSSPEADSSQQEGWVQTERAVLACAESWKKAREVQQVHMERLLTAFTCPTALLPFVPTPQASLDMIQELAQAIEVPDELRKGSSRVGLES